MRPTPYLLTSVGPDQGGGFGFGNSDSVIWKFGHFASNPEFGLGLGPEDWFGIGFILDSPHTWPLPRPTPSSMWCPHNSWGIPYFHLCFLLMEAEMSKTLVASIKVAYNP